MFICKCCPHRNDAHDMNCIECCPVSRAMDYAKGGIWETTYFTCLVSGPIFGFSSAHTASLR